eukprot:Skav234061  [mRNA]  locus=scaffold619:218904:221833:- [translate_table: standard]
MPRSFFHRARECRAAAPPLCTAMALNLTGLLPDERWIAEMKFDAAGECEAFRGNHRADVTYVVTMAARIIQMQSGFAMLEPRP